MIYDITDKANAIREVQKFLLELSYLSEEMPALSVDGIYGKETEAAVRLFQKKNGLSPTGKTDYATWQLLHRSYKKAREERATESELIPHNAFPMRLGDSGSHVRILQSAIDEILPDSTPTDGFYGRKTEEAVKKAEKRYGMPGTGVVTRLLWNRLAADYRDAVRHKIP